MYQLHLFGCTKTHPPCQQTQDGCNIKDHRGYPSLISTVPTICISSGKRYRQIIYNKSIIFTEEKRYWSPLECHPATIKVTIACYAFLFACIFVAGYHGNNHAVCAFSMNWILILFILCGELDWPMDAGWLTKQKPSIQSWTCASSINSQSSKIQHRASPLLSFSFPFI